MSFWKTAGDILVKGIHLLNDKTNAMNEEFMQYKDEFDHYDDEQLLRKYHSTSGVKKMACLALLKERGCLQNEDD